LYQKEKEVKSMVNPIIAAILSFIIPGLGQIIAGETKKGLIFLVVAIVLGLLVGAISSMLGIISLVFAIYAAYDAYQLAGAAE
jgi:TM2 domain-containing membrane protein YozV